MKHSLTLLLLCSSFLGFGQLLFADRADLLGVGVSYGSSNLGGGLSFCDFNGDGWDDLTFATEEGREILFFENKNGIFEPVDLGIRDTFETKQVLWVDYDNDGDKDLFATSIIGLNKLYENNGSMVMKDVTQSTGLFTEDRYSYGASFGDIDNDGDLDVFITHRDVITRNQYNYLYRNDDGYFTEITESAGLYLGNDLSFCAAFFDFDKDGYQDIYVSNDKYTVSNKLYRNLGDGTFEDVSEASGAGIAIDAMSTTIDDYNSDGWLDIYVTNTTQGNYHLRNNADGTFTNVADSIGTIFNSIGWGAVYLDAENDSDLDLYVSGMLSGNDTRLHSAFYENNNGLFSIPYNVGFEQDSRTSFANAIGDFNNDGLADIAVMNDTENNFLWQNLSQAPNDYLKIKLEGTVSNKDGIGSWIEIRSNGSSQFRYSLCGEGYLGQNSGYEMIGLGPDSAIEYIKVSWLSGIVDMITDVQGNTTVKIIEGSNNAEVIDLGSATNEPPVEEEPVEEGEVVEESIEEAPCGGNTGVVLFPNPSTHGTYEICSALIGSSMIAEVFDSQGRRVAHRAVYGETPRLDLTNMRDGIYYIRFKIGTKSYTQKVIKL